MIEAIAKQLQKVEVGMQALQSQQARLEANMQGRLSAGDDAAKSDGSNDSYAEADQME